MKLVVTYWVDCEYVASWGVAIPIEYESAEKFIEDFGNFAKLHKDKYCDFLGMELYPDVYFSTGNCSDFEVRTVEQWFKDCGNNPTA